MKRSSSMQSSIPGEHGFALLEVLVSIVIFSFGVLGVLGVQASMVKHSSDAKYRSEASYIAQQRLGQMWANPANAVNYLESGTDISSQLPSGTRTVTQPTPNEFLVTVTWQQPGEVVHSFTTTARINGGN